MMISHILYKVDDLEKELSCLMIKVSRLSMEVKRIHIMLWCTLMTALMLKFLRVWDLLNLLRLF